MHGDEVGNIGDPKCWKPEAIGTLQEAAKAFLVRKFESMSLENSECIFIRTSLPTSDAAPGHPQEAHHCHVKRHDSCGGFLRDDDR